MDVCRCLFACHVVSQVNHAAEGTVSLLQGSDLVIFSRPLLPFPGNNSVCSISQSDNDKCSPQISNADPVTRRKVPSCSCIKGSRSQRTFDVASLACMHRTTPAIGAADIGSVGDVSWEGTPLSRVLRQRDVGKRSSSYSTGVRHIQAEANFDIEHPTRFVEYGLGAFTIGLRSR